jgi:hypothetical protein
MNSDQNCNSEHLDNIPDNEFYEGDNFVCGECLEKIVIKNANYPSDDRKECHICDDWFCVECICKCDICGEFICVKCSEMCDECNMIICENCYSAMYICNKCGVRLCDDCSDDKCECNH